MARMSKGQYELLTEAMAEGLAEVRTRKSDMLVTSAMTMVYHLADTLEYDNPNFEKERFIQAVQATADLAEVIDDMKIDID